MTGPGRTPRARRETSAGGVVVRRDPDTPRVLLIRDGHDHWGFPKGHRRRGEPLEAAARREVAEETGVHAVEVRAPLPPISWEFRARGAQVHKTCHFFLMETHAERTAPQRSEGITLCRWATFEEAATLLSWENARGVLGEARRRLDGAAAPDGDGDA